MFGVILYIDAGTGSIIIQGLIAAFAGAAVTARLYWSRIKRTFGRGATKPDEAEQDAPSDA